MTGWSRPDAARLMTLVRERNASELWFADDGFIPNHPHWPLIIYAGAVGVARGQAKIQFGGGLGKVIEVRAGDVAILPAGTGHQRLGASDDFLVVGAYPPFGTYDICTKPEDYPAPVASIPTVRPPNEDPVYGSRGPLLRLWPRTP